MADSAPHDFDALARTLADGFGSLLEETKRLAQKERDLSRRLSALSDEVWFCPFLEMFPVGREYLSSRLERMH